MYLRGVREGSQLTKRELFLPHGGERFVEKDRERERHGDCDDAMALERGLLASRLDFLLVVGRFAWRPKDLLAIPSVHGGLIL